MHYTRQVLKRTSLLFGLMILVIVLFAVMKTKGQEGHNGSNRNEKEQWEYLALAGPSTTNLTPTNNPRMRKEPNSSFAREAFVLEQHLDKLGANGWELIAVAGPPTDPAYYFKRRK